MMKPKKFKLSADEIKQLIPDMGGCFASDHIMVDGKKVGFMDRGVPDNPQLTGWSFMSGEETQEYADNPDNWAIYEVNTVANYDPDIIPFLDSPCGSAFGRDPDTGKFVAEEYEEPED
jgi:hypothetical protein